MLVFLFLVMMALASMALTMFGQSHVWGHDRKAIRERAVGQYVELPIQIRPGAGLSDPRYVVNMTMGTPPQPMMFIVEVLVGDSLVATPGPDTNGLYVNSVPMGTFNPDASSTFNGSLGGLFEPGPTIAGTNISLSESGHYASDIFHVGDLSVNDVQFAIAQTNSIYSGVNILGLGLRSTEAAAFTSNRSYATYPNFLEVMVQEGLIQSTTYSIWFDGQNNTLSPSNGHLLLGAVNTNQYSGPIMTLNTQVQTQSPSDPIFLNESPGLSWFTVPLEGLSIDTTSDHSHKIPIPFEDAGVQVGIVQGEQLLSLLPQDLVKSIWDLVGAQYDPTVNITSAVPVVPCSYLNNDTILTINLGPNATIDAPLSGLIRRNGSGPNFDEGPYQSACVLSIIPLATGPYFLTMDLLNWAYVVYDTNNNVVSIAQRNFSAIEDNFVEIPLGGVGSLKQPDATNTTSSSSSNGLSHSTILDISLGVAIPVVAIIACIIIYMVWRRRSSRHRPIIYDSAPMVKMAVPPNSAKGEGSQYYVERPIIVPAELDPHHRVERNPWVR